MRSAQKKLDELNKAKTEQPKTEQPKTEQPKAEQPKAEQTKAGTGTTNQNCDANTGGGTNTGGSANTNTGGSTNTNTGGSANTKTGGSTNTKTGGSTNTKTGGSTNTKTGGSTNTKTGGSTNTNTGGSTNTNTGGSTNTKTGGSTNTNTGGSTNTNTGGSTNTNTGGGTNTKTGGSTNTKTGGGKKAKDAKAEQDAFNENIERLMREKAERDAARDAQKKAAQDTIEKAERQAREQAEREAYAKAHKKPNQDLLEKLEMIKKNAAALEEYRKLENQAIANSKNLDKLNDDLGKLNSELQTCTPRRKIEIETRQEQIGKDKIELNKKLLKLKHEKSGLNKQYKFASTFDAYEEFKAGGFKSIFKLYSEVCTKGNGFITSKLSVCTHSFKDPYNELESCKSAEKIASAVCDKLEDNPDCATKIAANSFTFTTDCFILNDKLNECSNQKSRNQQETSECQAQVQKFYKECRMKSCKNEKKDCNKKVESAERICEVNVFGGASFSKELYPTDCDSINYFTKQVCKADAWVDIAQIDQLVSVLKSATIDYDNII